MPTIKFFSVKSRKSVDVDLTQVKTGILINGRWAAQAIDPESGVMMFKILSAAEVTFLLHSDQNNDQIIDTGEK